MHVREAGLERRQGSFRAVEWIVRDSHEVEIRGEQRPRGQDSLVEVFLFLPVPSIVQVDHNLRGCGLVGVLHSPGAGVQQLRDIVIVAGFAQWPEKSAADLITNGDNLYVNVILCESVADVERVVIQLPGECVDVRGRPTGRGSLYTSLTLVFHLSLAVSSLPAVGRT